jgi:parallel beta-helix repeat protein
VERGIELKNQISVGTILIFLLVSMLALTFKIQPVRASGTIYIRADGSVDPISAPISTGDNITYTLTANINDSIVVERSSIVLDGYGYTLQGPGSGNGNGISLTSIGNVTIKNMGISGFTNGIWLYYSSNNTLSNNNMTGNGLNGIALTRSSYNVLSGNNVTKNQYGLYLAASSYNTLSGNNASGDYISGIHLTTDAYGSTSNNNTLSNNNATRDNNYGIYLYNSSNNTLSNNNASLNSNYGIYIYYSCSNNTLSGNNVYGQMCGVYLYYSSNNNMLSGNNVTGNTYGVYLVSSSNNNVLSGNNLTGNSGTGISLDSSDNNVFLGNNVTGNSGSGIVLSHSNNNTFYHNNFISNSQQVSLTSSGANSWDMGYPSGGNYWNNYAVADIFSGPYQNVTGSDGIGDLPYVIDANNTDRYPLITANFSFCTLNLNAGWNMISFPVIPVNASFSNIFSGVGYYQVLTWSGTSYATPTAAEAGRGYWALVLSPATINVTGVPVESYELNLSAGWSMIGSVYNATVNGDNVFPPPAFYQLLTWNGFSYVDAKPVGIESGRGYWALVLVPTHINVQKP